MALALKGTLTFLGFFHRVGWRDPACLCASAINSPATNISPAFGWFIFH
jgi:hypothetical protein